MYHNLLIRENKAREIYFLSCSNTHAYKRIQIEITHGRDRASAGYLALQYCYVMCVV